VVENILRDMSTNNYENQSTFDGKEHSFRSQRSYARPASNRAGLAVRKSIKYGEKSRQ